MKKSKNNVTKLHAEPVINTKEVYHNGHIEGIEMVQDVALGLLEVTDMLKFVPDVTPICAMRVFSYHLQIALDDLRSKVIRE